MDTCKPSETIQAWARSTGSERPARVQVTCWSKQQRRWRALRVLIFSWLAAAVSVLIPFLHFILVPLFILSGILLPYLVYQKQSSIVGGQTQCPHCDKALLILRSADSWPLQQVCPACNGHVRIEKS
jgi:hypothetical protein